MNHHAEGVSFVIPVRNGELYLDAVIQSVFRQQDGRPIEIIAVEDGSADGSQAILERYLASGCVSIVEGPRRGAAAALNEGIHRAKHPIICQVDQDVILKPGWMQSLAEALQDRGVAAAQGYYETPDGTPWARVMGLDLEDRYRRLVGRDVNHVCTGNTAYRTAALRTVGLFDESLGYGYDNDLSYRLVDAGYRLVINSKAKSIHHWRDGWWTYLRQQYGFGYGRLDVVAKHHRRLTGDDVSGLPMMLHAPLMALAVGLLLIAAILWAAGGPAMIPAVLAGGILTVLSLERLIAGVRVALRFRDPAGLWFVPMHLLRDLAWVTAATIWAARRVRGVKPHPADSMTPRSISRGVSGRPTA